MPQHFQALSSSHTVPNDSSNTSVVGPRMQGNMVLLKNFITTPLLLSGVVTAHPGHDVAEEAAERRSFLGSVQRSSLAHCADKLKARGIAARNTARRSAQISKARQKRGLKSKKRDLDSVISVSHNETDQGYTLNTDAGTLFAGINSCVLTPEVTQGPYCMYLLSILQSFGSDTNLSV